MVGTNRLQKKYTIVLRRIGRIRSHRSAGSKLIFFDLVQNDHKLQVVCNQRITDGPDVTNKQFDEFERLLRRGDVFCMCFQLRLPRCYTK